MEIHKLDSYNLDFLQSLIDNEIEESIHIEFKRAEALSKKDNAKKEVSKDVSAFANSDGGIIIYGIEEKNHKATNFSFVDGNTYTKEWLEQIISSTIFRTIQDLKIYPIRYNSEIEKTIYVVQIPSSLDAPHLSREKRFYKRYNFESVMMEEYEIRQSYGRKLKSKLSIKKYRIAKNIEDEVDNDGNLKYFFQVVVINDGEILETDYKVNVFFLNMVVGMKISWEDYGSKRDYHYSDFGNNTGKLSGIGNLIYPNESITVLDFNFHIPYDREEEAFEQMRFEVKLFYSNGDDAIELGFGKPDNDKSIET